MLSKLSPTLPALRSPRLRPAGAIWLAALCSALWTLPVSVSAQSKPAAASQLPAAASPTPSAVLLSTSGGHASARALDSVIGAALDDLKVVNVVARPGLDLGAVQLALDCVAETQQCLRMVTTQHEVDVLVAPTLSRISNELVLTLLRFDARSGKTQRVLKRQTGQTLSSDTLDAVPDLMRELFGLPPKPKVEPPAAAAASSTPDAADSSGLHPMEPLPEPPMEAPTASRSVPIGPLLLGGGGVLVLGAGLVMGLTVLNAKDKYESLTSNTRGLDPKSAEAVINQANEHKSTGQTNAVITNIFLGVGSAVLVAAGIWLAVDLTSKNSQYDDHVHLTPLLGAHEVGLVLSHRGAGL